MLYFKSAGEAAFHEKGMPLQYKVIHNVHTNMRINEILDF
jgi:hypothetical protein